MVSCWTSPPEFPRLFHHCYIKGQAKSTMIVDIQGASSCSLGTSAQHKPYNFSSLGRKVTLGISPQTSVPFFDVPTCTDVHVGYIHTKVAGRCWTSSDNSLSVLVKHFAHPAMNLLAHDSQ